MSFLDDCVSEPRFSIIRIGDSRTKCSRADRRLVQKRNQLLRENTLKVALWFHLLSFLLTRLINLPKAQLNSLIERVAVKSDLLGKILTNFFSLGGRKHLTITSAIRAKIRLAPLSQ